MRKYLPGLCLITLLFATNCFAYINPGKLHDYRSKKASTELKRLQEFHLQQAQNNIQNQQFNNAWGNLAYVLCQVPNHHLALQQMLNIAPNLHKESELQEYLTKAVRLYPDDAVVQMIMGAFFYNTGDIANATKHLDLAKQYGDLKTNDMLLKNPAQGQR